MPNAVILKTEVRDEKGKGFAKGLRKSGFIPAVVYGKAKEPTKLKVNNRELEVALAASGGQLINLNVLLDGKEESRPVLVKEVQRDPITRQLRHVDFHEISLTEKVKVAVPVFIVGEEDMEKDGGVLQVVLSEIEVECLPTQIPEQITVNVSGFAIGDSLRAAELEAPEEVEIVTPEDEIVVSVLVPAEEVEEEEVDDVEGVEEEEAEVEADTVDEETVEE